MKPFGSAEEWARQVIEAELGEPVHHHDDGSAPSMYDVRTGPVERPFAAIEVTAAADKDWTETWNIGADGDPVTVPGVAGDWVMKIEPKFRHKNLKEQLPPIIAYLKQKGVSGVHRDYRLRRADPALYQMLDQLGIAGIFCSREVGSGQVHMTMDSAPREPQVFGLGEWASDFLRDPRRRDVLLKLPPEVPQRHVFIPVVPGGAPISVMNYLCQDSFGGPSELPPDVPDLPGPLTDIWVVATLADHGVRWDGDRWRRFRAITANIDR